MQLSIVLFHRCVYCLRAAFSERLTVSYQAAIERAKRRESIELAAMQAYEEKLQRQEEERRKKAAGATRKGGLRVACGSIVLDPVSE